MFPADVTPPAKQHGDPLLDAAQGRGDAEDGTRHGHDATGPLPDEAGQSSSRSPTSTPSTVAGAVSTTVSNSPSGP